MAGRTKREGADYFSHDSDASSDEKIIYLESLFGHKGYAVYFKLLERMVRAYNFEIEWNDIKKAIYASELHISVTEIELIIFECCRKEIKAFEMKDGKLFSAGLKKRMQPLLDKRDYNRKKYEDSKSKQNNNLQNSETKKAISATEMTQSKVKESKGKNNIYTSNFLKFWDHYPKKIGKGAAYKAYKNIGGTKPSLQEILLSIDIHLKSEQWQNEKFIPHPATWLNQRRWEDEMSQEESNPKISVFEVSQDDR